MKKFLMVSMLSAVVPLVALAHGDSADAVEAGSVLNQSLQSGAKKCADLTDDDFEALGEFFMDRMMGEGHASMNEMMEQMMGEGGETQMHVTMGKRLSACETAPASGMGGVNEMANMVPMMGMMMGGGGMGSGMTTQNVSAMMAEASGTSGVSLKGVVILSYVNAALLGILFIVLILKFGRGVFK